MNETTNLLAEIRDALACQLEAQASYRDRCADEYPEDVRNERSALELWKLAGELRANEIYDDTPALLKLLRLVTENGLDPDPDLLRAPSTDSGFDASLYRFHDPRESDDEFLGRFADALVDDLSSVVSS